jgi:hypothetical protein
MELQIIGEEVNQFKVDATQDLLVIFSGQGPVLHTVRWSPVSDRYCSSHHVV